MKSFILPCAVYTLHHPSPKTSHFEFCIRLNGWPGTLCNSLNNIFKKYKKNIKRKTKRKKKRSEIHLSEVKLLDWFSLLLLSNNTLQYLQPCP
jgi:hypothetical protein